MKKDIQANINIGDAIQYVIKSYKEGGCIAMKLNGLIDSYDKP